MLEPAPRPVWHDPSDDVGLGGEADRPAAGPVPDVVVVGLGATGLTAIVELAAAGASVVGVDAAGIGAGAAGANGGFLLGGTAAFHHDAVARDGRAAAAEVYARTLDELARTYDEEPTARRTGSLRSAVDDAELADIRSQHEALRRDGVAATLVDGPIGPALLLVDDGVFDPMARCRRLAREARAAGATLATGLVARVTDDRLVVESTTWHAGAVVVAVDGGLGEAVPALATDVTSIRLQMLATAPQEQRVLDRPLYHRWGYDYAQQLPSGALAVGGGRDLEDAAARGGAPRPTATVQAHLDRLAARLGATGAVTHRWAARSAYTRDLRPIDREVAPGVHVLGGYSGHGNVVGPMLARGVARRVLAGLADRRGARGPDVA